MPSGKLLSRQIIEHPGAVVILPRVRKDRYLLIRQFRFAAGDWLWEFPAGGIEPGETKQRSAQRELQEETGFGARKLKKLFSFYPTPGISGEIMHLYLASNLYPKTAEQDEDEEIEVGEFNLREMGRMIRSGKIVDGKTIMAYYYLSCWRSSVGRATVS